MKSLALALIVTSLLAATSAQAADSSSAPNALVEAFVVPAEYAGDLGNYRSPLVFEDGHKVTTPGEWPARRQEILTYWHDRMGLWPPPVADFELTFLGQTNRNGIVQHQIRFRWTPNELTTGYLLVPPGSGKRPAVITVFYEPETAIGQGKPGRDFAWQLANRGFVTLSIGTTEASQQKVYSIYHPNREAAEVQPLSMLAYAASTARRMLAERPEVDPTRIGIVGHSFGGKWAMFASCLDEEFACAVWSDPGIVFDESRRSVNYWTSWYLGYEQGQWTSWAVPDADHPRTGAYKELMESGHNLQDLHALMAPRPFLVSGGSEDTPARWRALNHAIAVNALLGQTNRVAMTNRPDHSPTPESNEVLCQFFEHFLKPAPAP